MTVTRESNTISRKSRTISNPLLHNSFIADYLPGSTTAAVESRWREASEQNEAKTR